MSSSNATPTRVLVVDDSALYRQAICNILRRESGIEVAGIAANGADALEKIQDLDPDLLTLDVQMPGMDGIQVLREMNARGLRPKAIMVSSLTSEGAKVTTDALLEGAFDFILKPSGSSIEENRKTLRDALVEKIGLFSGSRLARAVRLRAGRLSPAAATRVPRPRTPALLKMPGACQAVLIATSTGGPAALKEVMPHLPADLGVPVLIVQHMPAGYTKALAGRLDQMSDLAVREAQEGMRLEPGVGLLAPGGCQMRFSRRADAVFVRVTDDPPENGCRPSADYMFRSANEAFGGAVLAVVLTGMGRDGLLGCQALKERGAAIMAQDEESATVYGMPKVVVEAGIADRVLPLSDMARAISAHVAGNRA